MNHSIKRKEKCDNYHTSNQMLKETGERQVKPFFSNIDLDHKEMYIFASAFIREDDVIADIGCGIGYGTSFLSSTSPCKSALGIDVDSEAIQYAKEHYTNSKVSFIQADICRDEIDEKYDFITAFEVVEHVDEPEKFLKNIADKLSETGILITSTPNENILHFNKRDFKFHKRHFTPSEFENMIESAGLKVLLKGSQNREKIYCFEGNAFNIFIAAKKEYYFDNFNEIVNKYAIEDNLVTRHIAALECANWYAKYSPAPNMNMIEDILKQIDHKMSIDERNVYLSRIYEHKCIYMPELKDDNPNFVDAFNWLKRKDYIRQEIICKSDELAKIKILFGKKGQNSTVLMRCILKDNEGKVVAKGKITEIDDENYGDFDFDTIKSSKGKKYTLILECMCKEEYSIYYGECVNNVNLFFNDDRIEKELTYRLLYR